MPIILSKLRKDVARAEPEFIELFAPMAYRRQSLTKALTELAAKGKVQFSIVEVSAKRSLKNDAARKNAEVTSLFAWFVSNFRGSVQCVDVSDRLHMMRKTMTSAWGEIIEYHLSDLQPFLRKSGGEIDLLYIDFGELADPNNQAFWQQCYQSLSPKPGTIIIANLDGQTQELMRHSLVATLCFEGYAFHPEGDGHIRFTKDVKKLAQNQALTRATYPTVWDFPAVQITSQHMFTRPYEAEVYAPFCGDFPSLQNRNVLIYWPHGLGDWVFLSHIIPLLDRSNRYFVTRFGDDSVALFEGSEYATPMYIGVNSPSLRRR